MAEKIYRWELSALDNVVQLLFQNGLITNIEARKMVCPKTMEQRKASMYYTILSKTPESAQNIFNFIRINMHPLVNGKILGEIFKFLKTTDIPNCILVCKKWKNVTESDESSTFDLNCQNEGEFGKNKFEQTLSQLLFRFRMILNRRVTPNRLMKQIIVPLFDLIVSSNSPIKLESVLECIEVHKTLQPLFTTIRVQDDGGALDPSGFISVTKALANDVILDRVFFFLSVSEMKDCRRVCHRWNSMAEPILTKRTKIIIRPTQLHAFSAANNFSSIPDLPHTAFKFTSSSVMFTKSQISHFISTFGHSITYLDLTDIEENYNAVVAGISFLNLTELYLSGNLDATQHPVPLDELLSIKVLHLESVVVNIGVDAEKRTAPVNILLDNVVGSVGGVVKHDGVTWNEFFNFSSSIEIQITGNRLNLEKQKFDWTRDNINAAKITLAYISFINWEISKAKIDCLKITQCSLPDLPDKSQMQINQVVLRKGAYDVSELPSAVKILDVGHLDCTVRISQPQDLPSLNFLCIHGDLDFDYYNLWSLLSQNCPNLQDLKLLNFETLDVSWIPRSVKNLQIDGNEEFIGDDLESINMHRLILRLFASSCPKLTKFVDKIRPKVLAITFDVTDDLEWETLLPFLITNTQLGETLVDCDVFQVPCLSNVKLDKIVVFFYFSSEFRAVFNSFEDSSLSECVDQRSRYYEFAKGFGNAINQIQFENYNRMVDEGA